MLFVAFASLIAAQALTFTGNADVDFPAAQINVTSPANFAAGKYQIYVLFDGLDVGAPPNWPYVVNSAVSGWDIKDIRFQYDYKGDNMHMAIDSYGIEGDADNDGDPGHTSPELAAKGGVDIPNFGSSESCAILLDVGSAGSAVPDGTFDWAIGYPGSAPSDSDRYPNGGANAFPQGTTCSMAFDTSCFGLYLADQQNLQDNLGARFLYKASDPTLALARSMNLAVDHNVPTTKAKPHLEWSILSQNSLRTAAGFGTIDQTGVTPFAIGLAVFCGSFQDDGIGEDFFPNAGTVAILNFPCQVFDACDVCGGNGSECADCKGVPNGNNKYDVCDVCGGNGQSCLDCKGVAFGANKYDVCDVCGGDGTSCLDCKKVPFGKNKYDACDVCGGASNTCLDCAGTPNGPKVYDKCDVCGGDGSECIPDCAGKPGGSSIYDSCDVCGGDGTSCLVPPPERNPCYPRPENDHDDRHDDNDDDDDSNNKDANEDDDDGACPIWVGDVFDAHFPASAAAGDWGLESAALTIGERGFAISCGRPGSVFQRFYWDQPKSGEVVVIDLASESAPTFKEGNGVIACSKSLAGTYTYSWLGKKCNYLQLSVVQDQCAQRNAIYNNAIFSRRECHGNGCTSRSGNVLFSLDAHQAATIPPEGFAYSGAPYTTITFSECGAFLEYHRNVTYFGNVNFFEEKSNDGHLLAANFSDVAFSPATAIGECANDAGGIYGLWATDKHDDDDDDDSSLVDDNSLFRGHHHDDDDGEWRNHNCRVRGSQSVSDQCTSRVSRLGGLHLESVKVCQGRVPEYCDDDDDHSDDDDSDSHRHHHRRHGRHHGSRRDDSDDDDESRHRHHSDRSHDDDESRHRHHSDRSHHSDDSSSSSTSSTSSSSSSGSSSSSSSSDSHHSGRRLADDDDDSDSDSF